MSKTSGGWMLAASLVEDDAAGGGRGHAKDSGLVPKSGLVVPWGATVGRKEQHAMLASPRVASHSVSGGQ